MVRSAALDAPAATAAATEESPFVRAGFNPEEMFQKTQVKFDGDKVLVQAQAPSEQALKEQQTPAQKLMTETLNAAEKELAARKAKNGSIGEADLKEIMPKYFPKMKEAVALADTQAAAGRKTAAEEYLRVKPDLEKFATDFPKAMERFGKASDAVPEAEGEKVGAMLTELNGEKTSAARKAEIRKDLSKYPDLAESSEALMKMSNIAEAKFGKMYQGITDMQTGLTQGLAYRGFYAESLKQSGGDPKELDRVTKEAQAVAQLYVRAMQAPQLLFMPPEDLQPRKPLPPVIKA